MFIKFFFLSSFYFQFLLSFQPSDVVFKLITKHKNNCGNPSTFTKKILSSYDFKSKKTAVLIHGWKPPLSDVQSYHSLCNCISKDSDNVEHIIIVDWTKIAGAYPNATSSNTQNIEYAAQQTATLLDKLEKNNGLDLNNVDLIGHSLGVYVAGLTGRNLLERQSLPFSTINGEQLRNFEWVSAQINIPKLCGVPGYNSLLPALNQYMDCNQYPSKNLYHFTDAITPMLGKTVGNIVALDPAGPHGLNRPKKILEKIGNEILEVYRGALLVEASLPKITIPTAAASIYAEILLNNLPKSIELNSIPDSLENSRFSLTGIEAQHITQYVSDPKLLGVPANSLDKSRLYGANVVVVDGDHGILAETHTKIIDWYCKSIKKCQFLSQNSNENLGYTYNGQNAGALNHIKCSITAYDVPKCCKEDTKPPTPSCVPDRTAALTDKVKQDFNMNKF